MNALHSLGARLARVYGAGPAQVPALMLALTLAAALLTVAPAARAQSADAPVTLSGNSML